MRISLTVAALPNAALAYNDAAFVSPSTFAKVLSMSGSGPSGKCFVKLCGYVFLVEAFEGLSLIHI